MLQRLVEQQIAFQQGGKDRHLMLEVVIKEPFNC